MNPLNKAHIANAILVPISVCWGFTDCDRNTNCGSILSSSSYCGVIGTKPTYGAIDRIGVLKTNDLSNAVG